MSASIDYWIAIVAWKQWKDDAKWVWAQDPHLLLFSFLPTLLFGDAMNIVPSALEPVGEGEILAAVPP